MSATLYAKHPRRWAEEKRAKAQSYTRGEMLEWSRRARDVIAPGVPVSLFLGFALNGGPAENTTGWVKGDAAERAEAARTGRRPLGGDQSQGFHELGAYGVPGGEAAGEAPNARGGNVAWTRLATDSQVRAVLSRAARTGAGDWRSVPDQCAVGLANLRDDSASVGAGVTALRSWSAAQWDPFRVVCAYAGWSAGPGGTAGHLRKRPELAQVEPGARLEGWIRALLAEGIPHGARAHSHAWDWYTACRTAQKAKGAELCAQLLGEDLGPWLSWGSIGDAELERLAVGAYEGRDVGGSGGASGASGSGAASGGGSHGPSGPTDGPLARASAWLRAHARPVVGAVVGSLAVGAAWGGVRAVQARNERRALEALGYGDGS